jgi:hexosaminidase
MDRAGRCASAHHGRRLLAFSLAVNALSAFAILRLASPRPAPLPVSASGWMAQPASEVFREIPSSPGAVVFLGDSLTAEGPWGELFGPWLNRGVKGDTVEGIRARLTEVLDRHPACVFLMIGGNDLMSGRNIDNIADGLRSISKATAETSPGTQLYILSLLPVDESRFISPVTNDLIRKANVELRKVAVEFGLAYIDLHSAFAGEDGGLRPELSYDGIHLTPKGYLIWRDILSAHVRRIR